MLTAQGTKREAGGWHPALLPAGAPSARERRLPGGGRRWTVWPPPPRTPPGGPGGWWSGASSGGPGGVGPKEGREGPR